MHRPRSIFFVLAKSLAAVLKQFWQNLMSVSPGWYSGQGVGLVIERIACSTPGRCNAGQPRSSGLGQLSLPSLRVGKSSPSYWLGLRLGQLKMREWKYPAFSAPRRGAFQGLPQRGDGDKLSPSWARGGKSSPPPELVRSTHECCITLL